MLHENESHDKHFPSLAKITSTRPKLNKAVDSGCLYFGDHEEFADDDAADEDVATADDDDYEAGCSFKCENADAVGSDGDEGLGVERGRVPTGCREIKAPSRHIVRL